ncbi:MAG: histidine kinase, partial [Bacteroidota bacterium]|nr:histidine kinase [Bacteroidota bacterium]
MRKAFITILLLLHLHNAYSQTTKQYDSLKNLISSAKDDSTKFYKTVDLIWDYIPSNSDSATVYVQQNILLAQKMESDEALFMGYAQYASLDQINGNYIGALQYGLQGMRAAEHTKNFISISEEYFILSDIYREAGDYAQAIYNLRKAKSLLESKLNPVFEQENHQTVSRYVACLVLAAQIFETFNQLDSALQYANKAHDLSLKGLGKWGTSRDTVFFSRILASTIGNIYSKTGDYSTALNYYRLGAALAKGNKDLMDNYNGAAGIFKKTGQLDSSIFYANKALELSKTAHFPIGKLAALNLLSDVYKLNHNTDSVTKYLELTIKTKDSLFNTKKVMEIQNISFSEQLRQQEMRDQQEQYQNQQLKIKQQELSQSSFQKKMLITGFICLLIVSGFIFRTIFLKRKNEKSLRELAENELQIQKLESQKKLSQLEMHALRAQMNPHFIFNSLSAINLFILENNRLQASEYLSKFARLVRLILQNSQEAFIPLDRELEALQLYLELESLRYEKKFTYKINTDDVPDMALIRVPPLIIQPYVENAIWH